jgi:hypothetical protein
VPRPCCPHSVEKKKLKADKRKATKSKQAATAPATEEAGQGDAYEWAAGGEGDSPAAPPDDSGDEMSD